MNDSPQCWYDGMLISADALPLSATSLGLTVGLGVFETIVMQGGRTPLIEKHLGRLKKSVSVMGLGFPDEEVTKSAIQDVLLANGLAGESARARVRVTLLSQSPVLGEVCEQSHLLVTAVTQAAPAEYATLIGVPMRVNEHAATGGIKCTSYADNVMAYRRALAEGADEALLLNTEGMLCECAMANIFLVSRGELATPALTSGCLPGVTRAAVIQLAREAGIVCRESDLSMEDLHRAEEMFITSSARGVQPAFVLGSTGHQAGEVSEELRGRYRDLFQIKS